MSLECRSYPRLEGLLDFLLLLYKIAWPFVVGSAYNIIFAWTMPLKASTHTYKVHSIHHVGLHTWPHNGFIAFSAKQQNVILALLMTMLVECRPPPTHVCIQVWGALSTVEHLLAPICGFTEAWLYYRSWQQLSSWWAARKQRKMLQTLSTR